MALTRRQKACQNFTINWGPWSETTSMGNLCSRTTCSKTNSAVVCVKGSPDLVLGELVEGDEDDVLVVNYRAFHPNVWQRALSDREMLKIFWFRLIG